MLVTDPNDPDYVYAILHELCTTCREAQPAFYLMRTLRTNPLPNLWVCRDCVDDTLHRCWAAHETVVAHRVTFEPVGSLPPVILLPANPEVRQMEMAI